MNKYIKNITESEITVGGKQIPASSFWELTEANLYKFAFKQSALDAINNDLILVSFDGSTTLSKSESLIAIRAIDFAKNLSFDNSSNGFESIEVQSAIEEVQNSNNNSVVGKLDVYEFSQQSSANNKWLEYGVKSIPSDESPAILPFDAKLIACTYTNDDDGTDTDIEVYKSAEGSGSSSSLSAKFVIRNKRVARFSDFTPIQYNAGDKISVFARDKGTNPSRVVVKLYFIITNYIKENDGEDFSSDFSLSVGGVTITIG